MHGPGEAAIGTLDGGCIGALRQAEDAPGSGVPGDTHGRGCRSARSCAAATMEKFARLERGLLQGAARHAHGDAEAHASVADLVDGGQARQHLTAERRAHDGGREVKLRDEHFADNLHPNEVGARIIAEEVFRILVEIRRSETPNR